MNQPAQPTPLPELPKCPQNYVSKHFPKGTELPPEFITRHKEANSWSHVIQPLRQVASDDFYYAIPSTPLPDAGAKEKSDNERKGLDRSLHADPVQREASKMLGVVMRRYELKWIPTNNDAEDFIGIATRFLREAEMRGREQVVATEEALNDMELGPSIQKKMPEQPAPLPLSRERLAEIKAGCFWPVDVCDAMHTQSILAISATERYDELVKASKITADATGRQITQLINERNEAQSQLTLANDKLARAREVVEKWAKYYKSSVTEIGRIFAGLVDEIRHVFIDSTPPTTVAVEREDGQKLIGWLTRCRKELSVINEGYDHTNELINEIDAELQRLRASSAPAVSREGEIVPAPDPLKIDTYEMARMLCKEIYSQREEILKAFIAKYAMEPDEIEQCSQQTNTGMRWYVRRRPTSPKAGAGE